MHDKDPKFSKDFRETLKKNGTRANSLPKASPNLNGRTEGFIGLIKTECLSKFIFFGQKHLDYVVNEYVAYYNERSHSSRASLPPLAKKPPETAATIRLDQLEVKQYVGGLIKSFERRAA